MTQEQQILRETVREFAEKEIAPFAAKIDWECAVPKELLAKLPGLGLFGITVPSDLGGAGADFLSLVVATEEVSRASGSLGAQLSFHNGVVCEAISASKMSNREQLLRKLAAGSLGAFDLSTIHEEERSRQVTCRVDGSKLIVNGNLDYVMNAASADVFLILGNVDAGTGSRKSTSSTLRRAIFAFSKDQAPRETFAVGEAKRLLGMRAAGVASLSFKGVELPLDSLVYEISTFDEHALVGLLSKARLAVASQSLGIAQASVDASVKYANERSQFDTKIGNFYAVQDMIASDCTELEAARAVAYRTAREVETDANLDRNSAVSKISSSNASVRASRHAIRVHGGYGFTRDYPVERYARDARLTQVWVESNEDLKVAIARSLLGRER